MGSRSLQVRGLRPAELRAVEARAARQGKTASAYVRDLINRSLLLEPTFDEILEPVRRDVRAGGLTEEQFDKLIDRARSAVATRRASRRRQ